ncbi:MAG: 3-isopropylmalate dehydratase small subunit [Candidatus Latescibacterota bacterium]|nr:3-isopropylmalate dehydratase small subunit [Candidatus Latescibacterota bacterium]
MDNSSVRKQVVGCGVPVRGADIDTDRIIPARYLRTITFENLGDHAFEDDRAGGEHPFDDRRYEGSGVLVANANFGCGSSREHAPQALMRWGINAFVAESFAEIFFGNCTTLGLPCVTATAADIQRLQAAVEADPEQEITVDVEARVVRFSQGEFEVSIPKGVREQLISGNWDSLGQLLDAEEDVAALAAGLPYTASFAVS